VLGSVGPGRTMIERSFVATTWCIQSFPKHIKTRKDRGRVFEEMLGRSGVVYAG
jgi:hypothetical protein